LIFFTSKSLVICELPVYNKNILHALKMLSLLTSFFWLQHGLYKRERVGRKVRKLQKTRMKKCRGKKKTEAAAGAASGKKVRSTFFSTSFV
jgi:hypothetical protein